MVFLDLQKSGTGQEVKSGPEREEGLGPRTCSTDKVGRRLSSACGAPTQTPRTDPFGTPEDRPTTRGLSELSTQASHLAHMHSTLPPQAPLCEHPVADMMRRLVSLAPAAVWALLLAGSAVTAQVQVSHGLDGLSGCASATAYIIADPTSDRAAAAATSRLAFIHCPAPACR